MRRGHVIVMMKLMLLRITLNNNSDCNDSDCNTDNIVIQII